MNRTRNSGELAFCSIITKNDIGLARTLADCLRWYHPGALVYMLLLDRPDGHFRPEVEPFSIISLDELSLDDLPRLRFLLTPADLGRTAKPYLLRHLLVKGGIRKVVYCDADLLLLRALEHLERLLDRHSIIVPSNFLDDASNSSALNHEADNPSVIALAHGKTTLAYLESWAWRFRSDKFEATEQGSFAERPWGEPMTGCFRQRTRPIGPGWPYTWASFDNGVAITERVRRCFLRLGTSAARYGDPFVTAGDHSFYSWLTCSRGPKVSPYLQDLYDTVSELRHAFPDIAGKDQAAYLNWAATHGVHDYQLDPALLGKGQTIVAKPCELRRVFSSPRERPVTKAFGLNVLGLFQSEKGVGEHCRASIRALSAVGVPHVLNNWVDPGSVNVDSAMSGFTTETPYPINLLHINAADTPFFSREIPGYFKGRHNIGYWNWELEWFPEEWQSCFQHFDEIWTASVFSQRSIQQLSPIPVTWMPLSIDIPPSQARTITRERLRLPSKAFVFLFAFDFHSYFARKNPVAAIEAFRRAFPRRRDVVLALKLGHWESAPTEYLEVLLACQGQANIRIIRDILSRDEMYDLLRLCDCYVGLHRSEGYGLPLVEAMALGKPVIGTDYSGNVDFMNASNSFPVRYTKVAIEQDHGPYRRGALWAEPDVEHAAEQMRRVVEMPETTARVAARARADIARTLSPKAVGEMMLKRLTALEPCNFRKDAPTRGNSLYTPGLPLVSVASV